MAEVLGRFHGILEANVYGVEVPSHDGRAGCAAIYIDPALRPTFDFAGLLAHARKGLPRYAVPIFLRIIQIQSAMHNQKQNKVPFRNEGIVHQKIREGDAGRDDVLMWVPPKGDTYVPFEESDYASLVADKARL